MASDERDWRRSAYLTRDNWPEAIPWTGPKRRSGPYPWGRPRHDDPYDLDDYPDLHPDAASVGGSYMGDVCPYCGVPLPNNQDVVLITGERGELCDVDDLHDPTPAYHPDCWRERQAEMHGLENTTLDDYADG